MFKYCFDSEEKPGRIIGPLGFVQIGAVSLKVMADSGSQITMLSDKTYIESWPNIKLCPTDVNPKAFGEFNIDMLGCFQDALNFKGRSIITKIYVAERGRNIVGSKDLARLGIILKPGPAEPIVLGDIEVGHLSSRRDRT